MGKIAVALLALFAIGVVVWLQFPRSEKRMSDVACLARNLAYETLPDSHSRPEARQELEAITHVVLRRKKLGRKAGYRDTVCGVVYQPLQFSWTMNKKLHQKIPDDLARWDYMRRVASDALAGRFLFPWPQSHECIVNYKMASDAGVSSRSKRWFKAHRREIAIIGSHRFYCDKIRGPQKSAGLNYCRGCCCNFSISCMSLRRSF